MTVRARLEVHQHRKDDVYKDRARIPEPYREGLKEGTICRIATKGCSVLLEVRGLQSEPNNIIRLDERTRLALGVNWGRFTSSLFSRLGRLNSSSGDGMLQIRRPGLLHGWGC